MYVLYFYDLFHILFVGVTKFSVCGMYNIYMCIYVLWYVGWGLLVHVMHTSCPQKNC